MDSQKKIKEYYNHTQFDYELVWNWGLKTTPALHFGYYDEKATKHAQAVFRANEVLADWAHVKAGDKVLDAGCGLGNTSIWLAQNRNAIVTGITLVDKQVNRATEFAKKQGVKDVEFLVADYLQTPFADDTFDIVWACESLCHTQDKSMFYKEAFRVLKPGGRLVIAENLRPTRPMSHEKEIFLKQIFDAWAIPDLDTLEEHKSHAAKAGFQNFEYKDVSKNVMVSYNNLRKTIKRLYNLGIWLRRLRIISQTRFDNFLQSGRQADALEQGVFSYAHIKAEKPIVQK
ncbi:MAG: methyltransferase domain-containing protein [Bacteroidetes bacterium]|nr:methyltransferase domain-containing protein [Bacteroidota bacterium]